MNQKVIHAANRILSKRLIRKVINTFVDKSFLESMYWKMQIGNYLKWYKGEISSLYECPSPSNEQKVFAETEIESAVRTWLKLHQIPKYLADLKLDTNAFKGMKLLDIGAGPFPSGIAFEGTQLYCLDPLIGNYKKAGFPIDKYENINFTEAFSENMPFEDNFFDAIICVNAIDHVDDFPQTVMEIKRVLKDNGKIALHVHSHPSTMTEPLELTEEYVLSMFEGIPGFRKVSESKEKYGWTIEEKNEKFLLFRNF